MKPIRNLMWFCVGLLISVGLFYMPYAHAQAYAPGYGPTSVVGPYSEYPPKYNPYLPNPATGAPSAASVANATGVAATQSGSATVTLPNGVKLPVPVSQTAAVSRAAIAKAVGKAAAKAIPGVGTAVALAEIAQALSDKGYRPNPDAGGGVQIVEKPGIVGDPLGTGYYYQGVQYVAKTPLASCSKLAISIAASFSSYNLSPSIVSGTLCRISGPAWNNPDAIATPYTGLPVTRISNYYVPEYILATEVQIEQDVLDRMAQQEYYQKVFYDALKRDESNYSGDWPSAYNPVQSDTPVSVNAPPVTSPERDVSVTQSPKPDGSVDTTTVKERTTVTPTTTGTTQGTVKTTFPSSTTTTTTITNNVTNIATTTTNVTNNVPAESEPAPEQEDPCKGNPDRAGCAKLGTPPAAEAIPKLDIPVSVTPVVFASSASCPPDLTYQAFGARSISYVPLCNKMSEVRPIFLALASFASAIIVMGFFRI